MGDKNKKKSKRNKSKNSKRDRVAENTEEVNKTDPELKENSDIEDNKKIMKRSHNTVDSDSESEKHSKTKKKKKQPMIQEEASGKKSKKSIRQMKREKYAQRQAEAKVVAKDQLKSQCLNYLSQWKHDRQNWKFMKAKQVWLYKNKFSSVLIPDASWPVFLEYFESAQGNIKTMLLNDANKIIKQMDDWTEKQNKGEHEENENADVIKPDDLVYNRARSLIQCLQE